MLEPGGLKLAKVETELKMWPEDLHSKDCTGLHHSTV